MKNLTNLYLHFLGYIGENIELDKLEKKLAHITNLRIIFNLYFDLN